MRKSAIQRVLIIKIKENEGLIVRIGRGEVRNCGFEVCAIMEGTTKLVQI
jgi:acetolactate synthase regulatory subunit